MKTIRNLKKSLIEIAQLLADSEDIQRLLVIDSVDAQTTESFTKKTFNELMTEKYITFAPLENAIKNIGRNSFMILTLNESNFSTVGGTIYIGTDEDHLMLSKNKFRLLELVDSISKKIDGVKISAAGTVNVLSFSQTIYSDFTFGYKIYFRIADQNDERADL